MPEVVQEQAQIQTQPPAQGEQDAAALDAEADAAFESGFNGERKDTPPAPPASVEATADTKEAVTPAPAAPVEDPWKGVPVVVRQSLEGIGEKLKMLDGIDHRVKSAEGRVAAMQKTLSVARTTATQVADSPTQQQITTAAVSSEKWKKLEEDFPEWTAALNERLSAMSAEFTGKLPKIDVDGIKKQVVGSVTPLLVSVKSEARELARVDFKHEGWEDTIKTKEFTDWFSKQPTDIQALAESPKSADAIKLLDAFKKASTPPPAPQPDQARQHRQQQRLEAAVTPQGSARQTPPALTDDDAFEAGFYGGRTASA